MARLPTADNLGSRPVPRSVRNVIPFRADIAQQAAAAAFAQDAKDTAVLGEKLVGAADEFAKRGAQPDADQKAQQAAQQELLKQLLERQPQNPVPKEKPAEDKPREAPRPDYRPLEHPEDFLLGAGRQQVAQALSAYVLKAGDIQDRLAAATNPETVLPRYQEETAQAGTEIAGTLPETIRPIFEAARGSLDTSLTASFGARNFLNWQVKAKSDLARGLDANVAAFAATQDPARRAALSTTSHEMIDAVRAQGFIGDDEARVLRRGVAERSAAASIEALPPAERFKALQMPSNWDGTSEVAPLDVNGTLTDFIPQETRLALARAALPGVFADRATTRALEIAKEGGDLDAWMAQARAEANPTVRGELQDRLRQAWDARRMAQGQADLETARRSAASWREAGLGADAVASEAAKLDNGRVRDAALQMMQTEYLAQHRMEQEQKTARVEQGLAAARKGEFDTLLAEATAAMDEGTRQALSGINAQALSGRPAQSAPATLSAVNRMTPEQLAGADLQEPAILRGLSAKDFADATARQQAIRNGNAQASADQRARSDLGDRMDALGLAASQQSTTFQRLEERAKAKEAETGKPATEEAARELVKQLPAVASAQSTTDTLAGGSGEDTLVGKIARDIGGGIKESLPQIAGGAEDAVNAFSNSTFSLAGWLNEHVIDLGSLVILDTPEKGAVKILPGVYWQPGMPDKNELQIPERLIPDKANTVTGSAIRGATQFLVGMSIAGQALGGISTAAKVGGAAKRIVSIAAANALFFEATDARLADLVTNVPELAKPVHDFLKSDPNESEGEARFKRALEGLGLGVLSEGLVIAFRGIRAAVLARRGGLARVLPNSKDLADMPRASEAVEKSSMIPVNKGEHPIEGLTTVPKGRYTIRDSTRKNARRLNKDIEDIGLEEFRRHVLDSGFVVKKEYSEGIRYEKPDGSKYFLRQNSTSRELPTAD